MKVKIFKNGNINIQKEPFYDGEQGGIKKLIERLCNSIELDFELAEGSNNPDSFGRFELFNNYTGLFYSISCHDSNMFDSGKTVKLTGSFL